MLEIKTINKIKKQRSYQAIKTSGVGFWTHKWSNRTRNKIFINSQKIPVLSFITINQAKEQGTNVLSSHRRHSVGFWSHKQSKRTRNKICIKSQKFLVSNFIALNQAKEQGANVLSRHRNFPFFFFWSQKQRKRTRNKVLIKPWKLAVLVF